MKLYTKRGDQGDTDLFGGQRINKASLRIEAIGTVDEVNSFVGLAACAAETGGGGDLTTMLRSIQSRLFEIGADLATPRRAEDDPSGPSAIPRVADAQVAELETWIDQASTQAPPMRHFILPGGTELSARLHVARTVCRRAERICVALQKQEPVGQPVVIYLNRLSDLLFAWARQANHAAGVEDVPWHSPRTQ